MSTRRTALLGRSCPESRDARRHLASVSTVEDMSSNPGDGPDEQNPFKGTPFEALFGGLSGGAATGRHARPLRADGPDAVLHAAPRRPDQLGGRHRHRPQGRRPAARPHPEPGPAGRDRRRRAPRRPLARRDHRLLLRRHLDGRLEPGRVDRGDPRRLEAPRRAGRRLHGQRPGRRPARGGPRHGRPPARHARQGHRCHGRQPGRPGRRRTRRRRPRRLRHRPAPRSGRQGGAAAAQRRRLRRASSTSAPTTSCSTSPCARPPTSASSPTCRGCASTSSAPSRPTAAASRSTRPAWRRSCAASTR